MPVITERNSLTYTDYGHQEGCGLWWIARGVVHERVAAYDGDIHYNQPDYIEAFDSGAVTAQGRIDHEEKTITVVEIKEGKDRSPSAERRVEVAINRMGRKYPDYEVIVFW